MKIKTMWSSMLIALILPINTSAFAVVSQPNFFSTSNPENIKILKTMEIAQEKEQLNSEDFSKKLSENQAKILEMINEFSETERIREKLLWESLEIENVDNNNINLNFQGRLFDTGRGGLTVKLTLNMKRNSSEQFNFNDYSYYAVARCSGSCRRRYISLLKKLPAKYANFDETIKEMFE